MKLYMMVTEDKYELPLCVADNLDELAKKVGISKQSISSIISHAKKKGFKCRYVKVVVD